MKQNAYRKDINAESVERFLISSSGNPETGYLPIINGSLDSLYRSEVAFPAGYYATMEKNDEVIVLNPFKDGSQKVIIGTIPNFTFGLPAGSRMIYTDNCQLILTKDGQIIINGKKEIKISNGAATITMGEDGVIDLN